MWRFVSLSDAQFALIADLLSGPTRRKGRPFSDARSMVEGIIYQYRTGISWRDLRRAFGAWQTVWAWHRCLAGDGTWAVALVRLVSAADAIGHMDWSVWVDSTIARAHQHATNITRITGGTTELHESADRAA